MNSAERGCGSLPTRHREGRPRINAYCICRCPSLSHLPSVSAGVILKSHNSSSLLVLDLEASCSFSRIPLFYVRAGVVHPNSFLCALLPSFTCAHLSPRSVMYLSIHPSILEVVHYFYTFHTSLLGGGRAKGMWCIRVRCRVDQAHKENDNTSESPWFLELCTSMSQSRVWVLLLFAPQIYRTMPFIFQRFLM